MNAQNGLQIDDLHCRAICDEVGDRLRTALGPGPRVLPVRLQILMAQLAAQDRVLAPSIAPSLDDIRQPDPASNRQSFAA
jgi:hypothetical protein